MHSHHALLDAVCVVEWRMLSFLLPLDYDSQEGIWGRWNEHCGVGFLVECGCPWWSWRWRWGCPTTESSVGLQIVIICWETWEVAAHQHRESSIHTINLNRWQELTSKTCLQIHSELTLWDETFVTMQAPLLRLPPFCLEYQHYKRMRVPSQLAWNTPHMALHGEKRSIVGANGA